MKRLTSVFLSITFALVPLQLSHAATPKAGAACSKLNQTQIAGKLKFTCIKSGKKLVWNKGVAIAETKSTSNSTPIPTPAPTTKAATQSTFECNDRQTSSALAAITYPKATDKLQTYKLGALEVKMTIPVTMRDMENSSYLIFSFTNGSSSDATVRIPDLKRILNNRPSWIGHMYPIIDEEISSSGIYEFRVPAGKTKDLYFYISNEAPPGQTEATIEFEYQLVSTGEKLQIQIPIIGINGEFGDKGQRVPVSAEIKGRVIDESGRALSNATVVAFLDSGVWRRESITDGNGNFAISLVSEAGFESMTGGRRTKPKTTWSITAEANNYKYIGIYNQTFGSGEVRTCTVQLTPNKKWNLSLVSTYSSDNKYGFWDMAIFGNGDRFVATPGWHPDGITPTLPLGSGAIPGDITAVDLQGNLLWKVRVGDFCWRMAVSADGKQIAANCADGKLYVISEDGKILNERVISNRRNSAAALSFAPDGKYLLTSSDDEILALDTTIWNVAWKAAISSYNAIWSNTSAGVVVFSDSGLLSTFTPEGRLKWSVGIGGVPLYLAVDDSGRIIAAGKSRVAHSWTADGKEIWSYEISQTSQRTQYNSGTSRSGDFVLIPSANGVNQVFSSTGKLLWQKMLPVTLENSPFPPVAGPGHNSNYVSPDGSFIAQGARLNQMLIYANDGSTLFESEKYPVRPGYKDGGNYHPSANSIAVTPDGKYFAMGSSDATIRIFKRNP